MKRGWLVPTGLIALSFVPVVGGAARVSTGPLSAPLLVHIVGATVYCVLGAFQIAPNLRRRRPGWHRAAGRVLVGAGLAAALSGIWLTRFADVPALRLFFGAAMAVSIVLAFRAIRRRDVATHRAWMIRAYAIAQGAGTQAILLGFGGALFDRGLLMAAAWILNLAIAEAVIRRRPARQPVEASA